MPTPTYTPLANLTLTGSAASVTFSSISQAYRDLVLVATNLKATTATGTYIRINNDSSTNYSFIGAAGNGSSAYSFTSTTYAGIGLVEATGPSTTTALDAMVHFMDYSSTDKHKTTLSRTGAATDATGMAANRWANTAAITTITIFNSSSVSFTSGSFALYGIAS